MVASSDDLHPRSGARFVLERADDGYRVAVYLPAGASVFGRLTWDARGVAQLEPILEPHWAHDEVLKLARVLLRDPKARLLRWRPEPH